MPPKKAPSIPSKTDSIKERLHLDGFIKQLIAEHIRALIRIYAIGGVKDPEALDLMYDILFIDPVTTRHFWQFQGMWKHRGSNETQYKAWWDAFMAFLRDCFDTTRRQMNRYHAETPPADYTDDGVAKYHVKKGGWYPGTPKMQPPLPQTRDTSDNHCRATEEAETRRQLCPRCLYRPASHVPLQGLHFRSRRTQRA